MISYVLFLLILNAANGVAGPIDQDLTVHGLEFVACLDRWMDAGFSIGMSLPKNVYVDIEYYKRLNFHLKKFLLFIFRFGEKQM